MKNTLHLNLKKKWFDMILAGIKMEEYRNLTDYWQIRLKNACERDIKTITFSNGYAKDRKQFVIGSWYIKIENGEVEWGAVRDKDYFVIVLGEIIKRRNC